MTRPHSTDRSYFRHCPTCGTELVRRESDGRTRPHCEICGFVQWRNPVVGVAAILWEADLCSTLGSSQVRDGQCDPAWRFDPQAGSRVLLVRRATSYRGLWCLPCGYVEFDEEIRDALRRELTEETGLIAEIGAVAAVESNFHEPDKQSVGVWFHAAATGGRLQPGDDVDRIGFFPPQAPPALAFPTDAVVLARLARDLDASSR